MDISNNTATHFECEVDNCSFGTIERNISRYFDMGCIGSSDVPVEVPEGIGDTYTLIGERKSGKFSVSLYPLKNGKYFLSVSLQGKLSKI